MPESSVIAQRRARPLRLAMATVGVAVTAVMAGMVLVRQGGGSGTGRPALAEHAAPKRPSLHAAPPADAAALNADVVRRLPSPLAEQLLPDARPGVVVFLKADCDCSQGFAVMVSALAPHLRPRAACTAVIEGTASEADAFAAATGLTIPFIAQPKSELAGDWGVRKAGCFALVNPDGVVEALWSGVSRQGFRDLAGRLGVEPPLPEKLLADIPGAATAGCPLECETGVTSSADPAAEPSTETLR